jgi:hypothetical protein
VTLAMIPFPPQLAPIGDQHRLQQVLLPAVAVAAQVAMPLQLPQIWMPAEAKADEPEMLQCQLVLASWKYCA